MYKIHVKLTFDVMYLNWHFLNHLVEDKFRNSSKISTSFFLFVLFFVCPSSLSSMIVATKKKKIYVYRDLECANIEGGGGGSFCT